MQCHNVTYPNTLHLDVHIYGLAQCCSNSIVLAMELPQPCAKPLTDHLSMGWCKGEITLVFSGLQLHIFFTQFIEGLYYSGIMSIGILTMIIKMATAVPTHGKRCSLYWSHYLSRYWHIFKWTLRKHKLKFGRKSSKSTQVKIRNFRRK